MCTAGLPGLRRLSAIRALLLGNVCLVHRGVAGSSATSVFADLVSVGRTVCGGSMEHEVQHWSIERAVGVVHRARRTAWGPSSTTGRWGSSEKNSLRWAHRARQRGGPSRRVLVAGRLPCKRVLCKQARRALCKQDVCIAARRVPCSKTFGGQNGVGLHRQNSVGGPSGTKCSIGPPGGVFWGGVVALV